jgi:hypothetical protein
MVKFDVRMSEIFRHKRFEKIVLSKYGDCEPNMEFYLY